ncbi:hypothetical protein NP233_g2317 [Leucocoprinus birnbaumii]|uniref:Uncharacterized protein n=1 Tax=Leucocoprinus birnbaumii TaxID=56174 RepID=A0AAD5YYX2_9AGAR|nr:hypothetical protein NP233_g2317 [Leucocoprinus birnbaumii]
MGSAAPSEYNALPGDILPRHPLSASLSRVSLANGNVTRYLKSNPGDPREPFVFDLILGLEYLHNEGIIHGDLKGANILVNDLRRGCIIDFGLATVRVNDTIDYTTPTTRAGITFEPDERPSCRDILAYLKLEEQAKNRRNERRGHPSPDDRDFQDWKACLSSATIQLDRVIEILNAGPSSAELTAPSSKLNFDAVPTIDFSLAKSDPKEYFAQLKFALEDVGFGIFVNVPGFEQSFQDEVFDLAAKLYNKPLEWKQSYGTANSMSLRGYFRSDDIEGPHKAYAEAFRFGAERPAHDDPSVPFWLRLHEGPNQWPQEEDLPGFRKAMETLFERYHALNLELNQHIAQLLDISPSLIDDYFPSSIEFNSAIWHYFPVTPEILKNSQNGFANGMHEHRDPSTFLTCLIQSRPGLQVQNHTGEWIDIPMVPGGVVCNVGMQFMRLTGGKLVATTHRVNTLKIDKDRFTIPYVLSTRLEKQVVPLPKFDNPTMAKVHVAPNPKIQALMSLEDPLIRSGYARLSLFPAAAKKLYPKEWEEAQQLGIV